MSSAAARRPAPRLPYLLVLPALLLLLAVLWPFLQGAYWAFHDFKLSRPDQLRFNGGANIWQVFTPSAPQFKALGVTLKYAVSAVLVETLLGLGVALMLSWPARWTRVFRVLIVLPMLTPPLIATILWKVMLVNRGVVDWLLEQTPIGSINWFGDPALALPTLVMIDAWLFTPFVVLILLAGLQSIPAETREAARVDGATAWQRFWRITLPMLRPFLFLVVLFRGIDTLKMFDIIWAGTAGGPLDSTMTLHVLAYQYGINYLEYGRSMALLLVLWALCYGLAYLLLKFRRSAGGGEG